MNPIKKLRFIKKAYGKLMSNLCPKCKTKAIQLTLRYKNSAEVVPRLQEELCDDCQEKLREGMEDLMDEFKSFGGKKDV